MKKYKLAASVVLTLIAISSAVFPMLSINELLNGLQPVPSLRYIALARLLPGPVFTLAFSTLFLVTTLMNKRMVWWVGTVGILGPIYTARVFRTSNASFQDDLIEFYLEHHQFFVDGSCILGGVLVVTYCIFDRLDQRLGQAPI
ncbi:MAG: hypothetical protein V4689_03025 [Verrucomicrobiota bacterium]